MPLMFMRERKDGSVDRVEHQSNERGFHRFRDLPIKKQGKGNLGVSISGAFDYSSQGHEFELCVGHAVYLKIK